ncbi:MAG: S53 family peptidase [Acidimicrobiales bacterium]
MNRPHPRTLPACLATALVLALAATYLFTPAQAARAGNAPAAGRTAAISPPSSFLPGRVSGLPMLTAAALRDITPAEAAPTPLPSPQSQVSVLTAVLKKMEKNYSTYAGYEPGPVDILDYGIGKLWLQGIDGAGTTIAVIEGWDDPDIAHTVAGYDHVFGLPNPQIQTIYPSGNGKLPAKCPAGMVVLGSYGSCEGWEGELTLDVLTAHLIAPYAKILISVTPADSEVNGDPASNVAPPEMMEALEAISSAHLANVISISDGTGESTYSYGDAEIAAQDPGELAAAAAGIPVLVATGDCGVVQNLAVANGQCEDVSTGPDTAAWDDSPWVTAVGGSEPDLSSTGKRLGPDPLWHVDNVYSEGAGYSSVFKRPSYQDAVASITNSGMRSVPDITMDASNGTSEAAPMLAGVLALATQVNKGNIGPINPALYSALGPHGAADGIIDVVSGNDSAETAAGKVTVPGFTATKGFDVASGWGTVFAPRFVASLVAATKAAQQEKPARAEAAADLAELRHDITLSPNNVAAGGVSYLLASGFLPGHPVKLMIGGTAVATLTATALGTVAYMIDPALLKLASGAHLVTLHSMLVNVTASFKSS